MSISTECLAAACEQLGIPHSFVNGDKNFLQVDLDRRYYFPGNATPFNDGAVEKICRDKDFAYKLLGQAMPMIKSVAFVDPEGPEEYREYARLASRADIVAEICSGFALPVIVKRNSGSRGQNVFLCKDREEVARAVAAVFAPDPDTYDHVLLAQEYVRPENEYRVVVFRKEVLLAYRKDISGATFKGNLSPLHWENSKAVNLADPAFLERMREFTKPIYDLLDLKYAGLDVIEDAAGELRLVELNARPGFGYFVRDNGKEPLVEMYVKMLRAMAGT